MLRPLGSTESLSLGLGKDEPLRDVSILVAGMALALGAHRVYHNDSHMTNSSEILVDCELSGGSI